MANGESLSRGALDVGPGGHNCGSSKLLDGTLCPDLEQQGGAACQMWLCSERNFWTCMFDKLCVLLSFADLKCCWIDLSEISSISSGPDLNIPMSLCPWHLGLTDLTCFWTDLMILG